MAAFTRRLKEPVYYVNYVNVYIKNFVLNRRVYSQCSNFKRIVKYIIAHPGDGTLSSH